MARKEDGGMSGMLGVGGNESMIEERERAEKDDRKCDERRVVCEWYICFICLWLSLVMEGWIIIS